ncbi:MAG: class F sortase, partial [Pseudonocardia sp.]|nr:class F sortase [Pseudonocardia sp.]
ENSQIRLVSCGGPFDDGTGHYLDNVIAYGTII